MRSATGHSNGGEGLGGERPFSSSNMSFSSHAASSINNNAPMPATGGATSLSSYAAHPFLSQQVSAVTAAQMAATTNKNRKKPESSSGLGYLPASAPVSSLLPPIPNQHAGFTLQSQLAALLSNSSNHGASNTAFAASQLYVPMAEMSSDPAFAAALAQQQTQQQQQQVTSNSSSSGAMSSAVGHATGRQGWTVEQLKQQVALLEKLNQPIPHTLTLLLAEARRKTEKKEAKRVANRKSACSSRARKKALVQEMTETNARLKRQALILALLPDMVIVIDVEGEITFCSAQVERILRHKTDDVVGAKLADLLVPSSRTALTKLVNELVESEKELPLTGKDATEDREGTKRPRDDTQDGGDAQAEEGNAGSVFASLGVKVGATSSALEEHTMLNSVGKNPTNSAALSVTRSPTASSATNSGSDDGAKKVTASVKGGAASSDGSVSTDAKKLQNANANLERNVRWHNKNMKVNKRAGYMDDVIGAAVTANNASARLSSLQHLPEACSDDSGYRESNDSREETSSSAESDSSASNGRRKLLAPTCNVCLIRDDLTTVWCEVTSSIRTKDLPEECEDTNASGSQPGKELSVKSAVEPGSTKSCAEVTAPAATSAMEQLPTSSESDATPVKESKELLLCLRPIRDGEEKVDAKYRFVIRTKSRQGEHLVSEKHLVSESSNSNGAGSSGENSLSEQAPLTGLGPHKKRKRMNANEGSSCSSLERGTEEKMDVDTEKSVVESLMLMNKAK